MFRPSQKRVVWEYVQVITVACAIVFGFIRPFVVEAFKIPSGSMEDTLLIGDRILVAKFMYGIKVPGTHRKLFDVHQPEKGDVIVFIPPHERHKNFIKRVVATEGDRVQTVGDKLFVNGEEIDGSDYAKYLYNGRSRQFPPFNGFNNDIPNFENWSNFSDFASDREFDEVFSDYTLSAEQFNQKFPKGHPFVVPKGYLFAMGDNRDQSYDSRGWGPIALSDVKGQAFLVYWSMNSWTPRLERTGKLIKSLYGRDN